MTVVVYCLLTCCSIAIGCDQLRSTNTFVVFDSAGVEIVENQRPECSDDQAWKFRLLAPIPFSVFQALLYLRLRRLLPFAIAHALMDGASVLIGVLLPLIRA